MGKEEKRIITLERMRRQRRRTDEWRVEKKREELNRRQNKRSR